jgi:hypothetical protein
MKKNTEWIKLLTDIERKQFLENLEYKEHMDEESGSLYDFICFTPFSWHASIQGSDYWSKIATSDREFKTLTIERIEAIAVHTPEEKPYQPSRLDTFTLAFISAGYDDLDAI